MSNPPLEVVIITGLSGAGRSTALHVLEDAGAYCVDNLPPALGPQCLELVRNEGSPKRVGLGIDVRSGVFLEGVDRMLALLEESGHRVELVFLDCSDAVLTRRFSETRRPHALAPTGDLLGAIAEERSSLANLRARADLVIDTSELTVHDLRRHLVDYLYREHEHPEMIVRLTSFGFKYGLPLNADLVFDLRFLPNPHFVDELRPLTGQDRPVADYVLDSPETQALLSRIQPLLEYLIPNYAREGKAYLTVALGCTGGRHRSVALVEELAGRLGNDEDVIVFHRDIARAGP